jgi:hypothetical protein
MRHALQRPLSCLFAEERQSNGTPGSGSSNEVEEFY